MEKSGSKLRELAQELSRSEEKYRFFFDHDPNPIFVFDAETFEILDANDRAAHDYHVAKCALLGRSFIDLTCPSEQGRVRSFLSDRDTFLGKVRQVRPAGDSFYVNMRANHGEYAGRPAVIATTADITERLRSEQQLLQTAKMATLGEMSAGLAHELNQPLTVINAGANFLLKLIGRGESLPPESLRDVLTEITGQVERATVIINHLREFGRKAEVEREPFDINEPIRGVFLLLGQQMRSRGIEVVCDLTPGLPPVRGGKNRLEQVFINLVLNARDAIEERRSRDRAFTGGVVAIRSRRDGALVEVVVADDGVGIPEEDLFRVFEPFFTTKQTGKGTGLGLSISYGIVRDFGGHIEVESEAGSGCRFVLSLPAFEGEA